MSETTMAIMYVLIAFIFFIITMVGIAIMERKAKEDIQAEKRMMSAMDKLFNMKEAT